MSQLVGLGADKWTDPCSPQAAQQITTERVSEDIIGVANVAQSSSATAEQVSAFTQETSASAQEISASAQELSTTAQSLETLVGRFTTR